MYNQQAAKGFSSYFRLRIACLVIAAFAILTDPIVVVVNHGLNTWAFIQLFLGFGALAVGQWLRGRINKINGDNSTISFDLFRNVQSPTTYVLNQLSGIHDHAQPQRTVTDIRNKLATVQSYLQSKKYENLAQTMDHIILHIDYLPNSSRKMSQALEAFQKDVETVRRNIMGTIHKQE